MQQFVRRLIDRWIEFDIHLHGLTSKFASRLLVRAVRGFPEAASCPPRKIATKKTANTPAAIIMPPSTCHSPTLGTLTPVERANRGLIRAVT